MLITGSTGFVGGALVQRLGRDDRFSLRLAGRRNSRENRYEVMVVPEIGPGTDWSQAIDGVSLIVHAAAVQGSTGRVLESSAKLLRTVNVDGTLALARQAAQSGVRRFVFLSSAKVHGEGEVGIKRRSGRTHEPGFACLGETGGYNESCAPTPEDPYAESKWEAERGLMTVGEESGMEVVILRPPLVYGPGVKGNFLRLLAAVDRGMPLPLGAVSNCRSMIYVENLVDAVILCLTHPKAAGRAWLVADDEAVSTPELIRRMAELMGRRVRLFRVAPHLLVFAGRILRKSAEVRRVVGSFVVDSREIRSELGWRPPYTLDEGLAHTVRWYQARRAGEP